MTASSESAHADSVSASELRELLHRLHEEEHGKVFDGLEEDDGSVNIEAICEVTGRTRSQVVRLIEEMRREDQEAEIVRRITELEEPLHRVERADVSRRDPLSWRIPTVREKLFSDMLEKMPQPEGRRLRIEAVKRKETLSDRVSSVVGYIILLVFSGAFVALIVWFLTHMPAPPKP